jgi:hypothetical protein
VALVGREGFVFEEELEPKNGYEILSMEEGARVGAKGPTQRGEAELHTLV